MRYLDVTPAYDLTYSDVFLVPSRSDVQSRLDVSLVPDDGTSATIPLVSANMNAVTGPRLAATLARRGGLGVLPQDMHLQDLDAAIRWVKSQPVAFDTTLVFGPQDTVADALRVMPPVNGHGIVVSDPHGAYLGSISALRLGRELPSAPLGDLLQGSGAALELTDLVTQRAAFDALVASDLDFAAVLEHGRVLGTITRKEALRGTLYTPAVDSDGALSVAAAVGINGDPVGKAKALVDAGVDVIVVDTAHGHQSGVIATVAALRDAGITQTVVAGNVVTEDAVAELAAAGADIIKVGVGPGAMCTTRMMTGVGRPQFSAVQRTAEAAKEFGAAIWADGGVRYPRDVALALAAGASSVMVGSWFAGTIESPGPLLTDEDGHWYKESYGMASTRAVRDRFTRLDAYELARRELFAEGISSSRILVDPLRPALDDLVDMITTGVRSAFSYAGAADLGQFRERAVVGVQSAAGYEEGKALPVGW